MRASKDQYLYVDKTAYIHSLVHSGKSYFLSRPRRFGKSLFLSALRAFWEGKKDLFDGLAVAELENDDPEAWQPYPVFYFDFNGVNYREERALERALEDHLQLWEPEYGLTPDPDTSISKRFQNLLMAAGMKKNRRCVILVDEYDKPLLEVMEDPELEEHNKMVFKSFFSVLKSYDEYIRFVFITGVTKFSKVSIFSDLNQLNDISINREYAGICGITEAELKNCFMPEIEAMAESQEMSVEECLKALKNQYDGYRFHPASEGVYNPFSLLKAFYEKDFGAYWFETGTPTFLVRKVTASAFDIHRLTDRNLYASQASLSDFRVDNPDPVPLLYQTGYLTIVDYDRRLQRYTLAFPNEEVEYGFLESLLPEYSTEVQAGKGTDIYSLEKYVEQGDLEGIRNMLTALFAGIPYTEKKNPFEHYFQTVLYLVFTLLGKYVHCEMHTFNGRVDCVLETDRYVYLFEFKRDEPAQNALDQIVEMGYALPYAADSRKIYKIGVSFDSERRMLSEWVVGE